MRALHGRDILLRPFARIALIGDGCVLAEPKASQPMGWSTLNPRIRFVSGERVADRIIADVADMQRAAGK